MSRIEFHRPRLAPRQCSECPTWFTPATPNRETCSDECQKLRRRRIAGQGPVKRPITRNRPAEDPRPTHPYLVAADAAWPRLIAAPPRDRLAMLERLQIALTMSHDSAFAEMVTWSLRERLKAHRGRATPTPTRRVG